MSGFLQVRRQDQRPETSPLGGPVPRFGQLHLDRPDPGQYLAFGLVTIADHVPAPLAIGVGMLLQKDLQLGQDGLPDCRLGVGADPVGHFVAKDWILGTELSYRCLWRHFPHLKSVS